MPGTDEELEELRRELRRHALLLDELCRRAGISPAAVLTGSGGDGGAAPDVLDALRAGNLIAAIKLHREHTGLGLKESKDAVEELARRHGL